MSHYRAGQRAEHRSRALLEALGYHVVRSAGSKGAVDLVAISGGEVLLIQVKRGSRGFSPAEREALMLLPRPAGCRVVVHRWKPRARLPMVEEL